MDIRAPGSPAYLSFPPGGETNQRAHHTEKSETEQHSGTTNKAESTNAQQANLEE